MSIATLPPAPQRTDSPDVFVSKSDAFVAALPQFVTDANSLAANLNSIAVGGAYTVPYVFDSTSTANSDPGNGKLRFNQYSAQNTTTNIYADQLGSDGADWSALLDNIQAVTSAVKGTIKLIKAGDATKWMILAISSISNPGGYRNITGTVVSASTTSPFSNGDYLIMQISRTGDMGTTGTLARRTASTTTVGTTTPDMNSVDMYIITAQASSLTLGTPTGTLADGRQLMYRIKDNGTAQTLAYTGVYRAPTELAFPSATVVGKTTYLGFVYNATDAKWDLVAAISNM